MGIINVLRNRMGDRMRKIPTHQFADDLKKGVQLRIVKLNERTHYDTSEPHRHNYYELFLFSKGGGTHMIDFTDHRILSQSMHLVKPGQVHVVRRELKTFGYVIIFAKDLLLVRNTGEERNTDKLKQIAVLEKGDYLTALEITNLLISESKKGSTRSAIAAGLLEVVVELLTYGKVPSGTSATRSTEAFATFSDLLEKNFSNMHRPSAYADLMALSEKKLNEIVKHACGKGAGEVIQDRIILEAKRLLTHSALSAKEIAFHLSFDDPSYFIRFFKRNTNKTPKDFQAAFRKKYHY